MYAYAYMAEEIYWLMMKRTDCTSCPIGDGLKLVLVTYKRQIKEFENL